KDPACELAAVERAITRAKHAEAVRDSLCLIHGGSHDNLENGAWSQLRLNRAIQQGTLRVVIELLPLFRRDADGKVIGVNRGMASHGQDFAAARIECNDGTGAGAQGLFGHLLHVYVDAELNLFAGNRFLRGKRAHFFSDAVDDDAPLAVGAHQDVIVLPFQAKFSRKVPHTQPAVARFNLLLADFTHVARGLRKETVRQVAPAGNGKHFQQWNV